jgi:adenylosuccinate synthase
MAVTAVLGAQWGDEGKGKIVDVLSETSDIVARFQGGSNAGHTIKVGERQTILHQIPSGILHPALDCILGNGMVLDPIALQDEIAELQNAGIQTQNRIHISMNAQVLTPLHKRLDAASEKALGAQAIGTTQRGIGPCYTDKVARRGIQVKDLRDPINVERLLRDRLSNYLHAGVLDQKDREIVLQNMEQFLTAATQMQQMAENTISLLHKAIKTHKSVLIEGAQGSLLDIDLGSYPYVTSSNTVAGNICTGLGINPFQIDAILGVYKAYTTRVGFGPFPTEQLNPAGEQLQQQGHEFGATTGRKRRCGWFDAVLGRYAQQINGFTGVVLTKLDVLDAFGEILICTRYRNGNYPDIDLAEAEPEYLCLPGWQQPIGDIRHFAQLPANAQRYVETLEELIETPVQYISVGERRSQIITKHS